MACIDSLSVLFFNFVLTHEIYQVCFPYIWLVVTYVYCFVLSGQVTPKKSFI